jgi:signal transduction histidine kinase
MATVLKTGLDRLISHPLMSYGLLIAIVPTLATFVVKHYFFEASSYDFIRVVVATSMLIVITLRAYKAISNREIEILKYRSESVFVIDQDANIIFCNELTLKHFGIGNLLGKHISNVAKSVVDINGEPLVSGPGRIALKGEANTVTMKSLITGRWMSVAANPVMHNGIVTHAICVMTDVTDLKTKELKQNQIIEERERFFGMVTHDLKSPLSAMLLSAELLRDKITDKVQLRLVEILLHNGKEVSSLINDLLELVKIQAEKVPIEISEVSIGRLIDELVSLNNELFKSKDLNVLTSVEAISCFCDERRIKQVINNLMSNAIKFSPAHASIKINVSASNEVCTFCFEDSGSGISTDMLQSIFEPFTQIPGKELVHGNGLGLSIVKYFVTAHGGRTWAESTMGVGTKFFFTLPMTRNPLSVS